MLFLSLILVQLLLFGVLVVFLRVVISRNITHATDHLNEINADYNQKLEDAKKRQADADRYYDEMLLKSKGDAEKIKTQILKETHETEERLVTTARKQGEDILSQATRAKEGILSEVEKHVEQAALVRACELVEQILPGEITREMHDRWCVDLLKHGLDTLQRLHLPDGLQEAHLVSAHPLEPAQKAAFEKKIREELGKGVKLTDSVDPSLIAGICVRFGSVVIDGSLKFKINETIRQAKSSVQR